ncbi:MAG: MBL fold metallo-hydrolase [Calditerrivibrio sp.]|nr:MBL fold metallo-hydrolase [Calditerrivibrio sp.]
MLEIDVISSGSSGNCYLITNDNYGVFIDIGVNKRDLVRVKDKLVDKKIYLFITHEHHDHIKGLRYYQALFNSDIFCCLDVAKHLSDAGYDIGNVKLIDEGVMYEFPGWLTYPFPLSHDSIASFGYSFFIDNYKISFVTDTGIVTKDILSAIDKSDILFLESNYEDDLLIKGSYPLHLKKRILSNKGHLSNRDALKVVHELYHSKLQRVYFAHISEENNSYDIMARYCKYCEKLFGIEFGYLRQKTHYNIRVV